MEITVADVLLQNTILYWAWTVVSVLMAKLRLFHAT